MSQHVINQDRPEVTCEIIDFISKLDLPRENVPKWRLQQEAKMKQILETYANLVEAEAVAEATKRTPVKRKSPPTVRPIIVTDDDLGLKRAKLMIDRPPAPTLPTVHHYNTPPPSYSAVVRGEVNRARALTSGSFIAQPVENQQTLSFRPKLFQIPDPLSFPPFNVSDSQLNRSGLVVLSNKKLQRVRQCF